MSGVVPGTADTFQKETLGGSPAFGETTMTKHNVVDRSLFNITTTRDHTSTIRNGQATIGDDSRPFGALDETCVASVRPPSSDVHLATKYPAFYSKPPLARLVEGRRRPSDPITQVFVTMTPQLASELLMNNHPNNRDANSWRDWADVIRSSDGEDWTMSNAIRLGPDLMVGDGQNRLLAVVDTKVPVPMIVDVYHDRAMFDAALKNVDINKKRTIGDAMVMSGTCERGHGKKHQPVITKMCAFDKRLKRKPSPADAVRIFDMYRSSLEWAAIALPKSWKAHMRAAMVFAHRRCPKEIDRLATLSVEKIGLHEGSAAVLLARRFDELNTRTGPGGQMEAMKQLLSIAHKHVMERPGGSQLRISETALAFFLGSKDNVR